MLRGKKYSSGISEETMKHIVNNEVETILVESDTVINGSSVTLNLMCA